MHSKDKKEYFFIVDLPNNVIKEFSTLEKLFKDHSKKTFGKNTIVCIEPDKYGSNTRYRFIARFPVEPNFTKETERSFKYVVKWAIADCKIDMLKRDSTMYGFFASKYKIFEGKL